MKGGSLVDGQHWAAALGSTQLLPMRVGRNAKTKLPAEKNCPVAGFLFF